MKFFKYFKEKLYQLCILFLFYFLLLLLLFAFKMSFELIIFLSLCYLIPYFLFFGIEYFRRKNFYSSLKENTLNLEKAYYVLETLEKPNFLEGKILYDILYEINKSMCEEVKSLENQVENFKDYIEMWIHEVKIPISSLLLMAHNKEIPKSVIEQIGRIEDYVEQILYYSRCENASKDYLIKKVSLRKIVSEVALKNKDVLLACKVDFIVINLDSNVYTDSKWLIFIVNQIVNNSIKYRKKDVNSYIKIASIEEKNFVRLMISDNGIGVKECDIPRVFEKTFTGFNGREYATSTGMGLYISKNLCEKLGHQITMESEYGKFTKITITFYKNSYYDVL